MLGEGGVPGGGAQQCAPDGPIDRALGPGVDAGFVGEAAGIGAGEAAGRGIGGEGERTAVDGDGDDAGAGGAGGEAVQEVGGGGAVAAPLAGEVDEQHVAPRHDGGRVFAPAVGALHGVAADEEQEGEEWEEESGHGGEAVRKGGTVQCFLPKYSIENHGLAMLFAEPSAEIEGVGDAAVEVFN